MTMNTSRSVIGNESYTPVRNNNLPSHFSSMIPLFRESYLISEYYMISNQPKLGGIYVIPSAQSTSRETLWFGVIFVHHGTYQEGVFRFTIRFPEQFPDNGQIPVVSFQPPLFHPQIHPTKGTLDLKRYFRSGWQRGTHHIWQILKIVKSIFYKIDTSTPINKAAAEMYDSHIESFVAKAKQEVELSLAKLYDEPPDGLKDPHYIRFSEYDPELHGSIKDQILKPISVLKNSARCNSSMKKGLSFLEDTL